MKYQVGDLLKYTAWSATGELAIIVKVYEAVGGVALYDMVWLNKNIPATHQYSDYVLEYDGHWSKLS